MLREDSQHHHAQSGFWSTLHVVASQKLQRSSGTHCWFPRLLSGWQLKFQCHSNSQSKTQHQPWDKHAPGIGDKNASLKHWSRANQVQAEVFLLQDYLAHFCKPHCNQKLPQFGHWQALQCPWTFQMGCTVINSLQKDCINNAVPQQFCVWLSSLSHPSFIIAAHSPCSHQLCVWSSLYHLTSELCNHSAVGKIPFLCGKNSDTVSHNAQFLCVFIMLGLNGTWLIQHFAALSNSGSHWPLAR